MSSPFTSEYLLDEVCNVSLRDVLLRLHYPHKQLLAVQVLQDLGIGPRADGVFRREGGGGGVVEDIVVPSQTFKEKELKIGIRT